MDKNVVAFLRDDVRSIHVRFPRDNRNHQDFMKDSDSEYRAELFSPQGYTYLTLDTSIKENDWVVVLVGDLPKCVLVVKVDDGITIDMNSTIKYKYVVDKVDFNPYYKIEADNKNIESLIREKYQQASRRSFKEALLGTLLPEERFLIKQYLKEK